MSSNVTNATCPNYSMSINEEMGAIYMQYMNSLTSTT